MLIRKILIANRGEIAIRIARTCREMGISPAGVYAENDRKSTHIRVCDECVAIGESYLNIDRMVDAARRVKADAVHPGYGFLSENADFAEACNTTGLIFIGPTPEAIRSMGLKTNARDIAASAGVPIVPSDDSQFPVIVKAAAGGGGRGMRIVREASQLNEALESAASEALRAFGDGTVFVERFIENARHVEFQIFGDQHGNLIHLFERDCTIQRRHQKIVEESPSPALDDALRKKMGAAAIAIGRAIGYTNAGTVEFLLAPSGEFYFIEVNTRIQVEHPVTELVTGLDLVKLQIEVAEGKALPANPRMIGHAIEARLYAEDPENGFLPSTGTVQMWSAPEHVRVETALEAGAEIGIHYDPMLAKIIAYGNDRETAVRKLVHSLKSTRVMGVETNRDYLLQLFGENGSGESERIAAAVLYLQRPVRGIPHNYRNNPYRDPMMNLRVRGKDMTVSWRGSIVTCGETQHSCAVRQREDGKLVAEIDGVTRTFHIYETATHLYVHSLEGQTSIERLTRHPRKASSSGRESANSPMPGQVLRIVVTEGQQVKMGEALVVLEAMKMEQTIRTTINGRVQSILVQPGQLVKPGQMLVEISAQENPE